MCFQPSCICCCRSLSRHSGSSPVSVSALYTHPHTHTGNAETVLQVLSSLNEENNHGKPSFELSSTCPFLNFFAHKLLEQDLKLPSVGIDLHVSLLKHTLLRTFPVTPVRTSWAALVSCCAPNPSAPVFWI